jgi:predicted nucleic acid-binding protein
MRKVVSNTTPVLSLLKLNKLSLLRDLYDEVIIPEAVFKEIENGKEKPYYEDLSKIKWLSIRKISNRESLVYFFDLDIGEAEVLVLAREINADLVVLDENLGRRYAKQLVLSSVNNYCAPLSRRKLD